MGPGRGAQTRRSSMADGPSIVQTPMLTEEGRARQIAAPALQPSTTRPSRPTCRRRRRGVKPAKLQKDKFLKNKANKKRPMERPAAERTPATPAARAGDSGSKHDTSSFDASAAAVESPTAPTAPSLIAKTLVQNSSQRPSAPSAAAVVPRSTRATPCLNHHVSITAHNWLTLRPP